MCGNIIGFTHGWFSDNWPSGKSQFTGLYISLVITIGSRELIAFAGTGPDNLVLKCYYVKHKPSRKMCTIHRCVNRTYSEFTKRLCEQTWWSDLRRWIMSLKKTNHLGSNILIQRHFGWNTSWFLHYSKESVLIVFIGQLMALFWVYHF